MIVNRIEEELDKNQPEEQAGFRKSYSTIDHLQTITQLVEKTNEFNIPLALLFIDFEKAFDSIETNTVLSALNEQKIDSRYISLLKNIFDQSQENSPRL